MENHTPENIETLKKQASDRTNYKNRLNAVEGLGNFKCQQSTDILWRLMIHDKVHAVQKLAFLKLQAFGENVKLPRKPKGHLVKDINKKLEIVLRSIDGEYSEVEFNGKFKESYPEYFDIYQYEKGAGFNKWVKNVLSCQPKRTA
ncbi:HEAT repeat domain-containing protein [Crenothrix sp.]|uniref:HEAT repeat domain-containing protein n=1 Tax=Crenothrix sp. TaxID=3100433 RepID=UPI00374D27D2